MEIEISDFQSKIECPPAMKSLVMQAVQAVLEYKNEQAGEVSIVWCDNPYIHDLNLRYRDRDCATDVLSFAARENSDEEPEIIGGPGDESLGDIFISLETAKRQAEDFGHSFEREVVYLVVHGMLHLLGMDHEQELEKLEMRRQEEEIMQIIGLTK